MKVDPEKFGRWVERKGQAFIAWDDRRTKARREKTLKDHRTLEICIALCAVLVVMGLASHASTTYLRSVCTLAAFVVFLKFIQLTIIALHGGEGSGE